MLEKIIALLELSTKNELVPYKPSTPYQPWEPTYPYIGDPVRPNTITWSASRDIGKVEGSIWGSDTHEINWARDVAHIY